ncbi:Hypothetical predicted protein [Marmota monax]|uniref:Uncharacterized protein n=1 Tax=Marmota monax TaxID=9995 RepID=A0A5E4D4G8_MARMO|nr:Hypothetical predicted protein [Marmota monax]
MDPMGAAESSVPPGPLTHLSLLDSSEALPQIGADGRSLAGSWTRQLERAEAAAAFNPRLAGGEGERGLRPSHWQGAIPPSPDDWGGASAASPVPAGLELQARAAGPEFRCSWRRAATLAAGMRWKPRRHFPEESPKRRSSPGFGRLTAWPDVRGPARLLPSVVPSRSEERP